MVFKIRLFFLNFNPDLQQTPRNVLSGVSAHHIYHELTRNATQMRSILGEVADLEINNIFIIGASSSVDYILGEASVFLIFPLHMIRRKISVITRKRSLFLFWLMKQYMCVRSLSCLLN